MKIDINQVLEDRIRAGMRKQAQEQVDVIGALITAELTRMGMYISRSPHGFLAQLRDSYEDKLVLDRVNAIVDGLLRTKLS